MGNAKIRDLVVEVMADVQDRLPFALVAWVVMPEHVHLLIMPDLPRSSAASILQQLKGIAANRVLNRWRNLNAPILTRLVDSSGKPHFWQRGGGYDRNIVSEQEIDEKFNYIHNNPVKRELVGKPSDWRWSSARWYETGSDEFDLEMTPPW